MPLYYLRRAGIAESDLQVIRFDTDIGKHGDTGRSELDAVDAVLAGEADVAAIGSSTWAAMGAAELMGESLTEVWRTDGYCHCMFTALDTLPAERYQPWLDRLLAMSWDDLSIERSSNSRVYDVGCLRTWTATSRCSRPCRSRASTRDGDHRADAPGGRSRTGATAEVAVYGDRDRDLAERWCANTGNTLVRADVDQTGVGTLVVRRGHPPDPASVLGPDRLPGVRLWLYTNFHCNLCCDYCCVSSSPSTPHRELGRSGSAESSVKRRAGSARTVPHRR